MMHNALYDQLRAHLAQIDVQIAQVSEVAAEMGIQANQVRNPDGTFLITPLLLAKAQTLSAMAMLETH
jgi:hypothetical protein